MYYELVNMSTGNRIGDYDTEKSALNDVLDVLKRRGEQELASIALVLFDDATGRVAIIAEGNALVHYAEIKNGLKELLVKKFPHGCTCTYYEPTPCPIHSSSTPYTKNEMDTEKFRKENEGP